MYETYEKKKMKLVSTVSRLSSTAWFTDKKKKLHSKIISTYRNRQINV